MKACKVLDGPDVDFDDLLDRLPEIKEKAEEIIATRLVNPSFAKEIQLYAEKFYDAIFLAPGELMSTLGHQAIMDLLNVFAKLKCVTFPFCAYDYLDQLEDELTVYRPHSDSANSEQDSLYWYLQPDFAVQKCSPDNGSLLLVGTICKDDVLAVSPMLQEVVLAPGVVSGIKTING
ncbi:hypothetical protein SAMN02745165_02877 [Malonomonas rubra DSM 5091]|uniref:Uncharacterized protein n=1 Tax=Malonomonas rubra DSM 5091 TaxID=1122189 RepID=A0A1M6L5J9_MALRU|nr:hypothetical protein [Malonomonas rubra]SHJ66472.1 hypothetical protein SAMN02745165_02877 [Malonomonas rubra DSM 5091]